MDGGFLHEKVILDPLESIAWAIGAKPRRQVRTASGRYMDLLIDLSHVRIGIEAELTARRIDNDLTKARDLAVDELWIVVPTVWVVRAVRSTLQSLQDQPVGRRVFVLTLGQARQRLAGCFSLFSGSLSLPENKKQIDRATR